MFEQTAVPLLETALEKHEDVLLMAYGITNAGKSHTMQGTPDDPGLTSRTLDYVFEKVQQAGAGGSVLISYLEIYNEKVHDLLNETAATAKRPDLKLMTDVSGRMSVQGLREVQVSSADEGRAVLAMGQSKRNTNDTLLNQTSSRSHAVFAIKVVMHDRCVKMSLVDLAGSERAGRTQNQGAKLKEAAKINNSLMALGQCFEALRWNQSHPSNPKMVPFRNCKITRLFQELLSGNGCVAMVVNVNPRREDSDETCHALRYASIASQIRLTPKVESTRHSAMRSRQPTDDGEGNAKQLVLIEDLWDEIDSLKQELLATHERSSRLESEAREEVAEQMALRLMEMEEAYSIRIKEEQSAITTMYEAKIKAMQRHHALELAAVRGIEYDVDKENTELSAPSQSPPKLSPRESPRALSRKRKSAEITVSKWSPTPSPAVVAEPTPSPAPVAEPSPSPVGGKPTVEEAKKKKKANRLLQELAAHTVSPAVEEKKSRRKKKSQEDLTETTETPTETEEPKPKPEKKKVVRKKKEAAVLSPAVKEAMASMQKKKAGAPSAAPVATRILRRTRSCRND
eukprot:TRINITY_DN2330_c0_g1_i3.p1 TRINITY_DN2330_c0_g1~~TRINITY_DN2330_c0_g1_i3.p1  ORF type:complete len:570 (-),score=164.75 TRINITY_DN2330_c0_g1_i3:166-1875(-)